MSQRHTTELCLCLLCLHSTHCSGSAVYTAVRDDLWKSDDPVVDLVSSSSLHCKNKWRFKYEFCNKYNFYEKIPGTFPTLYIQGFYFYLELDVKTHKTSLTQTRLFQTGMQTYLRCAVLFASHLWVPVDPPPSCKDKKKRRRKGLNNDIQKKMCPSHN